MSNICPRRWTCNAFAVDAVPFIDGALKNPRILPLQTETFAIAIASDSDVDVCELRVGGTVDDNTRIVVSSRRPWVGRLSSGTVLEAMPVRNAYIGSTGIYPDEYNDLHFKLPAGMGGSSLAGIPRLVLEVYGGPYLRSVADLPELPRARAPRQFTWRRVGWGGVGNGLSLYAPVHGRERFVITMRYDDDGGAATTMFGSIDGLDSLANVSGAITTPCTTTLKAFTKADFDAFGDSSLSYQYEGPPFEFVSIGIDTDHAGTDLLAAIMLYEDT